MHTLFPFLVTCLLSTAFIACTGAEQETILKVPQQVQSTWVWSWTGQWTKKDDASGKVPYYTACDTSQQTDKWIRSNVFQVGNASRIDVTVQYAVYSCSSAFADCKQHIKLFIYKTAIRHTTGSAGINTIPDPAVKPEVYQQFGTTTPINLTSSGDLTRNKLNTETYSFVTNSSTPYHYLAVKYEGGCFALYSVTISYSVCPSLALPSGLIQLPRTISPASGSIQVSGSCAVNAQSLVKNITLYGECNANGEWSSNVTGGECWCKAGYGKYLNGSGAFCNECPSGTYQDKASNKACKPCPLNSVQDVNRTKCNCAPSFYRTKDDSIYDNCTGQPSAPRDVKSTFKNASFVTIEWTTPLDLGGRSDVYYQVECKKCNDKGENCSMDCTGAVITHTPRTSRKATVQPLAIYTYYQFKVFSKNGVSHLAEKDGERSKYGLGLVQTGEGTPGALVVTVKVLSTTSVMLSWKVPTPNGNITLFQIIYYPVGDSSMKIVLNTTESSITINGLENGKEYFFQVRAITSAGFGEPSSINQTVTMKSTGKSTRVSKQGLSTETILGFCIPLAILLICIIPFIVWRYRKKTNEKASNVIPMSSERMFVDPSNYNSPLEALRNHTDEIDVNNLELKINIGEGEFADVYKAVLVTSNKREVVAVKVLKPTSSTKTKKNFILEASIMGQFKHPNVIELKGVVTLSLEKPMMIVTDFMENGSLEHFLTNRGNGMLTSLQLVGMARGVADGMFYLSRINFVHRDLAARNVLVAENLSCKISDFGLSRELEDNNAIYLTQGGKIPVRWTAPEAIRYRKFSSASDVWSYGILLWEIMSFAERPYWDWDNEKVYQRVEQGFRLPPPMNCPKVIHNIMLDCWEEDMNKRPKFLDIVKRLDELIRTPDKMSEQTARFQISNGAHVNLGMVNSVEEWLKEIKLQQYTNNFVEYGITELEQVMQIDDEGLQLLGITLIGHRNKIIKSIKELRKQNNRHGYIQEFEINI